MQLILAINSRTRIEYYANKLSILIPIKPLGFIVHGLCFLVASVFAWEGGGVLPKIMDRGVRPAS